MYIAPGWDRQTPGVKILMSTEGPYPVDNLLQGLKKPFELWFYTHFLMFFHVYIALRQGQTMPWGQNFDPNRKALSLWPFVENLKKKQSLSTLINTYF